MSDKSATELGPFVDEHPTTAVADLLGREALADPQVGQHDLQDRQRNDDHRDDHDEVLPVPGVQAEGVAQDLAHAARPQQARAARLLGEPWLHPGESSGWGARSVPRGCRR